jgi:hypothetical protein
MLSLLAGVPADADPVHDSLAAAIADFQAGDRGLALDVVDSLALVHADDVRVHSVKGQLHWFAGHRDLAEASFLRTLELDPDHTDARIHLKRLRFVPADFEPPRLLITDSFVLRPITAADAESDHAALVNSVEHLQGFFGPGDTWPAGVSLAENRSVLAWHEEEFADRIGFVYTVRSRFGDRCLGCVYIYPSRRDDFAADALYWVTADAAAQGMDGLLDHDVRFWLKTGWPFASVAYPGRDMSWEEYLEL